MKRRKFETEVAFGEQEPTWWFELNITEGQKIPMEKPLMGRIPDDVKWRLNGLRMKVSKIEYVGTEEFAVCVDPMDISKAYKAESKKDEANWWSGYAHAFKPHYGPPAPVDKMGYIYFPRNSGELTSEEMNEKAE